MVGTPGNALNITQTGVVSFDGTSVFTGSTLTQHDVLIGGASNGINSLTPGASGTVLTSNGAGVDPSYQGVVVPSFPITVPQGGTGRTTLTNHGVLVGAATTAITQLAAGSAGQVLQSGGASADPAYSTATYPLTTTINQILYSSSTNTVSGLSTAINSTLVTDGSGIPSISQTLPNAVQTNISTLSNSLTISGPFVINTSGSSAPSISIQPANSATTASPINITGGQSQVTGGAVIVLGGPANISNGSSGVGGAVTIQSGSVSSSVTGISGNLLIGGGNGRGTNKNAGTVKFQSSQGTGTGHLGTIEFDGGSLQPSGSNNHIYVPRMIMNGCVTTLVSGAASTIATLTLASNTTAGGLIFYSVEDNDGTTFENSTGVVAYSAVNTAGTITGTTSILGVEAISGTLTNSWSVTSGGLVQLTSTSLLTPTTFRVTYTIMSNSQQSISIP